MPAPTRRVARPRYPSVSLGALPVDGINKALGTELEPGNVRLSSTAHRHIAEDHPDDYADCIAALPAAVAFPTFAGQGPGHTRNFEIVKRVSRPDRRSVLVAIGLEMDESGEYRVKSCYLIAPEKVDKRRTNGTLRQIIAASK